MIVIVKRSTLDLRVIGEYTITLINFFKSMIIKGLTASPCDPRVLATINYLDVMSK